MVWGGKVPSLEVFWEGASGEGWNEKRDGSPVLALQVGEQAFLWGGGSPGMGHGITRDGQATKARLSEDGWRAISRQGGCLVCPHHSHHHQVSRETYIFITRGAPN